MNGEGTLRSLLGNIEERIDPQHAKRVTERHRAALDYQSLDVPPLVLYLPYEASEFGLYPYPEAFDDPVKMMVNELLLGHTSVYHAVDLGGDTPYCLRPNFGTGIMASVFGAKICLTDNNMPWVEPIGVERIHQLVQEPMPDLRSGLMPKVLDQYGFFDETLAQYPKCREALNITLPDLQGPFDTAAMLWGSDIFEGLYTEPELVSALLDRIAEAMIAIHSMLGDKVRDQLSPEGRFQHATGVKGRLLLREDSAVIMLSPKMYHEVVRPVNERIAGALGSVAVHFCGNGQHQVENLLAMPGMACLDFGQAYLMDIDRIYAQAADRRVPLVRVTVPEEQLTAAKVKDRFPRGVILVASPQSLGEARALLERYEAEA